MTLLAGRYTLEKPLGEGGMGVVYLGLDTKTETPVAIKKLRPDTLQNNPHAIERFNREAQALRDLNHPNIVKSFAAFEQDGGHYIIMEYVEGSDLFNLLIREGRLPLAQVMGIGIELSDALTRAHYLRIIHRDLKPANVLLDANGRPKLSDFGVAYLETQERVTGMGISVGTPAYMAPEVLNGKPADGRADLWALGVMLFEMLTAQHPFRGDNLSGLLINVLTQPIPDLESLRPDCPVALADLIYRMLERDPEGRVSSARVVGLELEQLLSAIENQSVRATDVFPQANLYVSDNQTVILNARNNLPAQTTPFIGRELELADLARLIDDPDTRLITVLGAGGMGKTRVAIAAASAAVNFDHGIFLVELAPLASAEPLLATLANAIGFQFSAEGEPAAQIADYLREKRMLLILDNFEHVLSGAAVVNDLLRAAPGVTVIATSREKLNLLGETLYVLDGLDLPTSDSPDAVKNSGAVQLFLQSARRARPGFVASDEDLPLISQICQTVDGLPLGIVLAAAWIQTLSLGEVIDEIKRGLDFLETELGDVPLRHRSIRAVFEYSWALMREDERDLVARLSVFRGGLSRRAGQEVAGAGLRPLAGLVNKSLLRRDPDVGSYHMHELLRQYAEGKLEASGKASEVCAAHSRYYMGVLGELRPLLEGGDQISTLRKVADDIENVRAAWAWAVKEADYARITAAQPTLSMYFELRGQYLEGEMFFEGAAISLRQQAPSAARDFALGELLAREAKLAVTLHQRERTDHLLAESAALLNESAPPLTRAALSYAQGYDHLTLKKVVDARPYLERAAALYRAAGENWALARTLDEWSATYWYRTDGAETDLDQARSLLEEAQTIQKMLGDVFGLATTTLHLGTIASYALNDAEDARLTAESLFLFQQVGNLHEISQAFNNMGVRELINGHYEAAHPYLEKSLHIRRDLGGVASIAWALFVLTRLSYCEGDFNRGIRYANEGLSLLTGNSHVEREAELLLDRAELYRALGEYAAALEDYGRVDVLARQVDNRDNLLHSLHRRGAVALAMGDTDNALAWLTQAKTEAEAKDDQTTVLSSQALLARLNLKQADVTAAREQIVAPVDYFTDEEAWQMSYSTDQWQMSGYAVEALLTQADVARMMGDAATAKTALTKALKKAQSILSPAHLLSVSAAYADLIETEQPGLAATLAARVATHRAGYAVDKLRARAVLLRAAANPSLEAESFAQACLDGETLPIEAVIAPMTQALF